MGLVAAPDPELTAPEWEAIAARSREEEDSRAPCVICCEEFRDRKQAFLHHYRPERYAQTRKTLRFFQLLQVLLSCGHVFHRECLSSWERHSRSRICPVCRKQHYRKRSLHDAANLYKGECATRLQAAWRGLKVRKQHAPILRRVNPERLRRYCEDKLTSFTNRLISRLDAERLDIDALFAEIDDSVAYSRTLMGDDVVDWNSVEFAAKCRGIGDCPVCLAPLLAGEQLALLSCSHVFHGRCIESFERYDKHRKVSIICTVSASLYLLKLLLLCTL